MTGPAPRHTRSRARLIVEVDLDPVHGFGHEPESWRLALERHLDVVARFYRPTVVVERVVEARR